MWTCVSRLWGRYLRMEWMRNHCFNLKCQTVFQNECTTLSYHQQCLIVPFSELPPAMSDCTVLSYHQQCLIVPFSELPPAVSDCTVFWVTTSSVWQVQLFCTFVNTCYFHFLNFSCLNECKGIIVVFNLQFFL